MEIKVRRHQHHLPHEAKLHKIDTSEVNGKRGGPMELAQLQLRVLHKDDDFVVLDKGPDERMDGAFDVTLEKALARDFPHVDKFRWIHQLDFVFACAATSGVLVVGLKKEATATACRLFREKQVQKEYLALVRGHLPLNPAESVNQSAHACTFSKLGLFIQDTEDLERMRNQQRGSKAHFKMPGYPRGVRHGPNIFAMEQAELLRKSNKRLKEDNLCSKAKSLTAEELAFTQLTWHGLSNEEKRLFSEKAIADKQRYAREFNEFLRLETLRLAHLHKYESLAADKSENVNEPLAYIFDAPIIEPHQSLKVFRMVVGKESNALAKQSTTLCFVLGHAIYDGEPVSKVLLRPLNGRRHQLRLHLAHHGFPIVGDVTYGSQDDVAPRMMLHAWRIWLHGSPTDQERYGDLYFESSDPFEAIVPSARQVCTITYQKDGKNQVSNKFVDSSAKVAET
ncbi:hypothetical protein CCR75_003051 [Bremia lactucae]|uniref:HMG box domain-containing protein n=1 Tax=Bremia lactucae TaxID=4779 RepID=A0A976P0N1_BRELC|nr:hypothetical protein CCR75_003051 [Bremia lactucae]